MTIYELLDKLVVHSTLPLDEQHEASQLITHLREAGAFGTLASRAYTSDTDHEHEPYKVFLDEPYRGPFRGANQAPALQLRHYIWACKICKANLGNGEEYVNR